MLFDGRFGEVQAVKSRSQWFIVRVAFMAAAWYAACTGVGAEEPLVIDTANLPPRSTPAPAPRRPVPEWTQTHWRARHLPGSLPMGEAFLKAGYNVVTLNVLGKWEVVGPSAPRYPPERVKEAAEYMRTHVERCHAAGAKAVFYLGPGQVPSGNAIFVKAHPDWLRIAADGPQTIATSHLPSAISTPGMANCRIKARPP